MCIRDRNSTVEPARIGCLRICSASRARAWVSSEVAGFLATAVLDVPELLVATDFAGAATGTSSISRGDEVVIILTTAGSTSGADILFIGCLLYTSPSPR